jgi:phosphoribosylaminoimidazole-succinocarboxamide synthase
MNKGSDVPMLREPLLETNLPGAFHKGKVRDTYELENALLMVTTDRLSAYDSVLPGGIPGRGIVLSEISALWLRYTQATIPNHFIGMAYEPDIISKYSLENISEDILSRSMVVKKAERIDVECIVRGYITGSAWADYKMTGKVQGYPLPEDLQESQQFAEPIFTPTTKEDSGHDQPLTLEEFWTEVGGNIAWPLEEHSLALYTMATDLADSVGLILADTKFEFGFIDGKIHLIDELLTPDSSRYWNAETYAVGKPQESYDKQIVRNWLDETGWDRISPPPKPSEDVVAHTIERYLEVYKKLTGKELIL